MASTSRAARHLQSFRGHDALPTGAMAVLRARRKPRFAVRRVQPCTQGGCLPEASHYPPGGVCGSACFGSGCAAWESASRCSGPKHRVSASSRALLARSAAKGSRVRRLPEAGPGARQPTRAGVRSPDGKGWAIHATTIPIVFRYCAGRIPSGRIAALRPVTTRTRASVGLPACPTRVHDGGVRVLLSSLSCLTRRVRGAIVFRREPGGHHAVDELKARMFRP